jgi:hypothetical protein
MGALCVTKVLGGSSLRVWLVTWEWSGNEAAVVDKVAMILSQRLTAQRVAPIVQLLYAHATSGLDSLAEYAKHPSRIPYLAEVDGQSRVDCGHNPWLHAEQVTELEVVRDPDSGIETIGWVSQPQYKRGDEGPKIVQPGRSRTFKRFVTGPPSHAPRWDRTLGRFKDGFDDRDA